MTVQRKNLSFAQQVAIDRHYNGYDLGGCWDPFDRKVDTDCSDSAGKMLAGSTAGTAMSWARQVSTESWRPPSMGGSANPLNGPYGTVMVDNPSEFPADAAVLIGLHHGDGSAADSHMWVQVDKLKVETHGSDNQYPDGATVLNDGKNFLDNVLDVHTIDSPTTYGANNWWYLPGPIVEDGTPIPTTASPGGPAMPAQPTILAQGVDYSGGLPGGAALAANNVAFACRYVFNGSPGLPYKLLTLAEANDLWANGVDIVSNYESTGTDATNGYAQGVADANDAQANHAAAGGPANAPIYFSLDWDESNAQDPAVIQYFQGVASVIGLERTGAYGSYWILTRLFAAGVISWGWQAEAWSSDPAGIGSLDLDGDYVCAQAQLLQRNNAGYLNVGGVECDIDVALAANYGQWHYAGSTPVTPPAPPAPAVPAAPTGDTAALDELEQFLGPFDPTTGTFTGWPQLNATPDADTLAALQAKVDAGADLSLVDGLAVVMHGIKPTPKASAKAPTRKPVKRAPAKKAPAKRAPVKRTTSTSRRTTK